jgi:outer membrane lipoprotein carrier protein
MQKHKLFTNYYNFFLIKLFFVLFIFSLSFGEQGLLIERIKSNYSGNKSFSAKFDLNIFWKVREKEEKKQGRIIIAPKDKFRVEVGNVLWMSNGITLWEYDKNISQVKITNFSSGKEVILPSQLINKYFAKYHFNILEQTKDAVILEWKCDSLLCEEDLTYIKIIANPQTAIVLKVFTQDKKGNQTTYTFKDIKFDINIPASEFSFVIPKGVRILDNR